MRRYKIDLITPSPLIAPQANPLNFPVPGKIRLIAGLALDDFEPVGDLRKSFHGKEWVNGLLPQNAPLYRQPFYTYSDANPPPLGTGLLVATTFEIVENTKYNGRYTTFTQTALSDSKASVFVNGKTEINVLEAIMDLPGDPALSEGYVTNISTYVLGVAGEPGNVLLERENNDGRVIELHGRLTSGWGEVNLQNFINLGQSFAGDIPPLGPFMGTIWYDTSTDALGFTNTVKVKVTSGPGNSPSDWRYVNGPVFGIPYRHTQPIPASTWTITHNKNVPAPFVIEASFFVDIGAGIHKPIIPQDVTYVSANQMTVTFTNNETGIVLIR